MARSRTAGLAGAGVVGLAAGLGLAAWPVAIARSIADTPGAAATFGVLAAVAFALGTRRDGVRAGAAIHPERSAGVRLLALGGLTIALGTLHPGLARLLAAAGGGIDASPVGLTGARAIVGGLFLVPAGFAAGTVLRLLARRLPEGPAAGRATAVAAAAAATGWAAAHWIDVPAASLPRPPGPERPEIAVAAGVLAALAGLALAWRARGARPDKPAPEQPPEDSLGALGLAPAWSGFGVALALAAFPLVGQRVFAAIVGNDLPGLAPALLAFGFGLTIGAVLALFLGPRLPGRAVPGWGAGLVAVSAAAAVFVYGRFDSLPAAFAESLQPARSLAEALGIALGVALPRLGLIALPLGAAAVLVAGRLPGTRASRNRWVSGVTAGAAAGALAGALLPRLALPSLGLEVTAAVAALAAVVPATVAVVRGGLPGVARALLAVVAPGIVAAFALRMPPVDRDALIVERRLRSEASMVSGVQQHWRTFDEDDFSGGWCILRRGHSCRLFVNGRFELASETAGATHGLLAHLPLSIHPQAARVAIVGVGSAVAVRAALSHPVERVDILDVGRVPFRAAAHLGPEEVFALQDARVELRPGDPRELLLRADPYDVILGQLSGAWTERSARSTTASFLSTVRDRLAPGGIYCLWVPGSSLTREGFLVLLATVAEVFPQVECWAGEGADVLVLAKPAAAPHDFGSILESYGDPKVLADARASWIGTPDTMLSHFLVGDASVRAISAGRRVHDTDTPELGRPEADRRRRDPRVNPVPGLAQIADPPTSILTGTPAGLEEAVRRAREARERQMAALDLELADDELGAADQYRRALALNPNDGSIRRAFATLRTEMGISYTNRMAVTAAHAYMREAVEIDTTFAQGFGNLGWLLMRTRTYDYAIACTLEAIELAPDDDLFPLQLGRIWKMRGYLDKAIPWYERAMAVNPRNVEAAIGYSDAKLAMESEPDLRESLDFLLHYLEIDPHHEDLQYRIGKLRDAVRRVAAGLPMDESVGGGPEPDEGADRLPAPDFGPDFGPGGAPELEPAPPDADEAEADAGGPGTGP